MRHIDYNPSKFNQRYTIPINKGGTGASDKDTAIKNLGGINLDMMNKPNGFAGLSIKGFLDPAVIPPGVTYGVPLNIYGPELVELNTTAKFEITNYDSFTDYNVTFNGVTGYREDEFIYVTATKRGSASIEVNGSFFPINIDGNSPVNTNIVGGELMQSLSTTTPNAEFGACVAAADNGVIVVGSPGYSSASASQVGLMSMFNKDGALIATLTGDPGPLNFSATMSTGAYVDVSSDAPGYTPVRLTESSSFTIPAGSSTLTISGKGAPGRTEWVNEVLGTALVAFDARAFPAKFYFEVTAIKTESSNTKTTKYKSAVLNNTSLSGSGIHVDVTETNTNSATPVTSTTRMNYRASYTQAYFDIQDGPLVYDSLRIRIYAENGVLQTGMVADLTYVSTNSGTNLSSYVNANIERIRQGHVNGKFQHFAGGNTVVSGNGRSLTMAGGFGDDKGLTVARIGNALFAAGHKVFLEFRYNNHPLSTQPCTLTSPLSGTGLNLPINIGRGRDVMERELTWILRQTTSGTTVRSASGEVMMSFESGKIRITPLFTGNLWQAAPSSAVLVLERTVDGQLVRNEFAMAQVGTDMVFEVPNLTYGYTGEFDSEYRDPDTTNTVMNTTGGNRFGELFVVSPTSDVLAIGIKKEALSGRGKVLVYTQMDQSTRVAYTLLDDLPANTTASLGCLGISDEGDFLLSGYPDIGTVLVHRRQGMTGYLQRSTIKPSLAATAKFGTSIDASSNGKLVAISAPGNGRIYLYDNSGAAPVLSKQIQAPTGYTVFGRVVRICADGKLLAVSTKNAAGRGVIRIYRVETSPTFLAEIGQPTGTNTNLDFGATFDMSPYGEALAIGAPGNTTLAGNVFLFFNGSKNWEHYKTLASEGNQAGSLFGSAVSLGEAATTLVVGAKQRKLTATSLGEVTIYGGDFQYLT